MSSVVNIADPGDPSKVAKVDQAGRLSVGPATASISVAGWLLGYTDNAVTQLTSATTATLAISRIQFSDPSANSSATEQQLSVNQYPVDSAGNCQSATGAVLLARYNLAAGDDVDDPFPAPLIVKPSGTTKYCLYVYADYLGTTTGTPSYYLTYGVSAYVVSGKYTGLGTTPAAKQQGSAAIPR
ncbi:hypothetical protein ACXR2U_21090 [Jatrophihabitans sp. YIM 134969]